MLENMKAFIVCMLVAPLGALALPMPSFDCLSNNLTVTEQTICRYEELSDLDLELGFLYQEAQSDKDVSHAIQSEQVAWLKHRNKHCSPSSKTCLADVYRARFAEMKSQYVSCEMIW